MKKKNKILAGVLAGACVLGGGFALVGCGNTVEPTLEEVQQEFSSYLSRFYYELDEVCKYMNQGYGMNRDEWVRLRYSHQPVHSSPDYFMYLSFYNDARIADRDGNFLTPSKVITVQEIVEYKERISESLAYFRGYLINMDTGEWTKSGNYEDENQAMFYKSHADYIRGAYFSYVNSGNDSAGSSKLYKHYHIYNQWDVYHNDQSQKYELFSEVYLTINARHYYIDENDYIWEYVYQQEPTHLIDTPDNEEILIPSNVITMEYFRNGYNDLKKLVIDSSYIANGLTNSNTREWFGNHHGYPDYIYIKSGLNVSDSTWLKENYSQQLNGDKEGYVMYIYNKVLG